MSERIQPSSPRTFGDASANLDGFDFQSSLNRQLFTTPPLKRSQSWLTDCRPDVALGRGRLTTSRQWAPCATSTPSPPRPQEIPQQLQTSVSDLEPFPPLLELECGPSLEITYLMVTSHCHGRHRKNCQQRTASGGYLEW